MNELTDARLELMRRRLARAGLTGDFGGADTTAAPAAPPGRLGAAERRMWKIYRLDPDSISHNIGLVLDFDDAYSLEGVIASFELMARNAEVLGSVVAVDDDDIPRRVSRQWDGRWVELGVVWEWGAFPAGAIARPGVGPAGHDEIRAVAKELAKLPFRLTREPPLRARLYARENGGVSVALVVHHLAVDDSSWPVLLGTLVSGSWPAAVDVARPATPVPADRPDAVDPALRHALGTWAADGIRFPLSGSLPEIDVAQSWLSPLEDRSAERVTAPIDPAGLAALEKVARDVGATSNALHIVLFALSVYVLTDAADHVLLVPADNRRPGQGPDRVGYTGNIIPVRFTFAPTSNVRDALRDAVATVYRSMEFSAVDYGAILTALRTAGKRFPVAEILASVRNAPLRGIPIPAEARVTCESVFTGIANYPLAFAFEIGVDDRVHLEIDYQPEVVDKAFARRAHAVVTALVARIPLSLEATVDELVRVVRHSETDWLPSAAGPDAS